MSAPTPPRAPLPPIKFAELAEALLAQADQLVPKWLPGGKVDGHEYKCADLSGGEGESCSVNLGTGRWADFAGDDSGGDLLSLYASIFGLSQGKAAVQVAREEGLESVAGLVAPAPAGSPPPAPRPPPPPPSKPKAEPEGWKTIQPVPAHAPEPTFRHYDRKPESLMHTASYRVDEDLLGFVVRFRTSDGGKDTLPYTWCQSAKDGAAKWHWRQWDEPRPLYLPGGTLPAGRTVIMVEGEVKAEVLQALLDAGAPGVYCVVSWPGGSKVWQKADWSWLAGAYVLLWPDCDAQRERLTASERKETPEKAAQLVLQQAKPLLPNHKQPGMAAMLGIGSLLRDTHGCTVQLLPTPEPGSVNSGWDCRDAIEADGWTFADVQALFARGFALPADVQAPAPTAAPAGRDGGAKKPPRDGPAEAQDSDHDGEDPYLDYLRDVAQSLKLRSVGQLQPNRKMLVAALRMAPALKDTVAYDMLRSAPCTRANPWPWREEVGPLEDTDDLRFGDWIDETYGTRSASRGALQEALDTVADERRFHPIRDWLQGLVWDKRPRLEKWLIHVLGHDPATLAPKLRRYLELVGRYILLGQVYRVLEPGCKFDYSVVLEGITGKGKSTMVKTLVGEQFFSDTHFDIGAGKDGMEQLAGIWAYELSEMTAFRRADSEAVKAFFSTTKDRYRGAYGRYVKDHKRQVVIWCTTNKRQYLYDITGNRRFWPVWVGENINIAWLDKWRAQLFAEAMAMYLERERNWPTEEEERLYFRPEQEKRLIETSVQSRLYEMLTREGAPGGLQEKSVNINQFTKFVTVSQLVTALGTDPGKSSTLLETQIRDWLMEHGWTDKRETVPPRRRGFEQPEIWPPVFDDDEAPAPAASPASTGPAGDAPTGNQGHGAGYAPQPWGGEDDEPF